MEKSKKINKLMNNFTEDQNLKPQEQKIPSNSKQKLLAGMLLEAGIEFALIIAAPLIAFVYLGKKLDAHYNTKYLVILGIFIAIFISSMGIWSRIKQFKKLL